ncbi:hypothetical protein [uncultured Roseobacter sp.]|uniref:hypothetical protein n=1 Tax=uncultured Roseobacter sp. TaxID=114847 RepID=UPI00263524A3|nr:hypothetical protein [uncultured Roseobacter sp.]
MSISRIGRKLPMLGIGRLKERNRVTNQLKLKTRNTLLGAAMAMLSPMQASAYEVDCAILLCLSGGWPASAECNHARAVFIQRITPWPVEPPLQIWHCPMGAAMNEGSVTTPGERLRKLAEVGAQEAVFAASYSPNSAQEIGTMPAEFERRNVDTSVSEMLRLVSGEMSQENGIADIDVSGPEFDFIRSIKVWNILHYSHAKRGRNDECREQSNITLGTYGAQGEFRWLPSEPSQVPDWAIPTRSCEPASYTRAVGVEWTDTEGNHGFEVVPY